MPNALVVARLVPGLSAKWTSHYGWTRAKSITSRPFLALRTQRRDLKDESNPSDVVLFLVSSEKPRGRESDYYFPLQRSLKGEPPDLNLSPALNLGAPLYLHASPMLMSYSFMEAESQVETLQSTHSLDEKSLTLFGEKVREGRRKLRVSHQLHGPQARTSGGDEVVEKEWDSWSGMSQREWLNIPLEYVFEYLPFKPEVALEPSTIREELLHHKQLAADYSWKGVTSAVNWVTQMRESIKNQNPIPVDVSNIKKYAQEDKMFDPASSIHGTGVALSKLNIPFDGGPPVEYDEEEVAALDDGWGDEPEPEFEYIQGVRDAVPASEIKVVIFDLSGAILDRERAIREALAPLSTNSVNKVESDPAELYLEKESLEHLTSPGSSQTDLVSTAIASFCAEYGVSPSPKEIVAARDQILQPKVHPDVALHLAALQEKGMRLITLSATEQKDVGTSMADGLSGLMAFEGSYIQTPEIFTNILDKLKSYKPEEVLVVSTGAYRVLEAANSAGLPTAWMERDDTVESTMNEKFTCAKATLRVKGMAGLCQQLGVGLN